MSPAIIRLTDTLTRSLRPLEPIVPDEVGIYLCGPTVQSPPHVGHLRSAVAFDLLRRWLIASGYHVTFVVNVTDIDDKILVNAAAEGVPWWEVGTRNTRAFDAAYDALGVLPPTCEPRATGHVTEMVELMQRLIERGHAYPGDGGDVWFDVRSWPRYGELSGQRPDAMVATETSADKRDPLDFALWKGARPGEPTWPTPWGDGRPGWHLECSAMATKYLGPSFDIHGAGQDLVFPHHENELAQSAAAGDGFARLWLHHGTLTTGGAKMSKSVGNSLLAGEVLARARPAAVRYYLGAPQLRSDMEWSEDGLAEAEAALSRVEGFLARATEVLGPPPYDEPAVGALLRDRVPAGFAEAMDDDIAVPRALSVLHAEVRAGNNAIAAGDKPQAREHAAAVSAMVDALGLSPENFGAGAASGASAAMLAALDGLVPALLAAREAARERRDYAEADRLRDAMSAAGVTIQDTPAGPRWRLG